MNPKLKAAVKYRGRDLETQVKNRQKVLVFQQLADSGAQGDSSLPKGPYGDRATSACPPTIPRGTTLLKDAGSIWNPTQGAYKAGSIRNSRDEVEIYRVPPQKQEWGCGGRQGITIQSDRGEE